MSQDQPLPCGPGPARRWDFRTGIALVFVIGVVTLLAMDLAATGFLKAHLLQTPEGAAAEAPAAAETPTVTEPTAAKTPPVLFRDWPTDRTPDLVLVLSGQQHGYINPCGCSPIQYGGLPRRWNLMQSLSARGWPVAGVDLGDLIEAKEHRTPQTLLRYETSMKALKRMNYAAVGLGVHETEMPLLSTLGQYALNDHSPRILAANLKDRETNFADLVGASIVGTAPKSTMKVGVVGIMGPNVRTKIPTQSPPLNFGDTSQALTGALQEMQANRPELYVLLYQGTVQEARACAKQFKSHFHIILCESAESEPTDKPERVEGTGSWIINVGQKGRYVGVVGAYRTGNAARPLELKYQLVMLGPEWETKPGQKNPVLDMLEAYTKELKDGNYLAKYSQRKHPLQVQYPEAKYVGSAACRRCHQHAFEIWKNHPNHAAYPTLVSAKNPGLRQFDGECIVCHTVGFGFHSGYENETKTPHLKEVGCENCHGPGSLHVKMAADTPAAMLEAMNPFKPKANETKEQEAKRLLQINLSCQKCHDVDNDPVWDFEKRWPNVVHHTPKKKAQ